MAAVASRPSEHISLSRVPSKRSGASPLPSPPSTGRRPSASTPVRPSVKGGDGSHGSSPDARPSLSTRRSTGRSSDQGARKSSNSKSRKAKASTTRDEMIMDEQLRWSGVDQLMPEDHLEDLVSLPISDELLPTKVRAERMREAATASTSSLATNLVFGLPRARSSTAADALRTARISTEDLALQRQVSASSSASHGASPLASTSRLTPTSSIDHQDPSRSRTPSPNTSLIPLPTTNGTPSSRATTTASPQRTPKSTTLTPASEAKPMSRSPSAAAKRPTTASRVPRSNTTDGLDLPRSTPSSTPNKPISARTTPEARKRAVSGQVTGTRKRPSAGPSPPTSRSTAPRSAPSTRPRSFSASSIPPDATPPWAQAAPPILYRSTAAASPTTAALDPDGHEPLGGWKGAGTMTTRSASPIATTGNWDDAILPVVGRRILQEQLAAANQGGEGLIAEYDAQGRPVRLVAASPVKPSHAVPDEVEGAKDEVSAAAMNEAQREEVEMSEWPKPKPLTTIAIPNTAGERPTTGRTEAWQQPGLQSPTQARKTFEAKAEATEASKFEDDGGHGGGCCRCTIM